MKILFLILLTLLLSSNSHAQDFNLNCDKAFLNPIVYHMCNEEEAMIKADTQKLQARNDEFLKLLFEDAKKLNIYDDLQAALDSEHKTPTEEYLIHRLIYKNKKILEKIQYDEYKLAASKEEIEMIMKNYFDTASNKIK